MFHQFSNIDAVTDVLHPVYRDQVNQSLQQAGPLLSVLEVYARFEKLASPPAPSPVGAYLSKLSFRTWEDPQKHIQQLKRHYIGMGDKNTYDAWTSNIERLVNDNNILLAHTVPLFAASQMRSMTNFPSPAQTIFLNLLSPIIMSKGPYRESTSVVADPSPNASIHIFLHAGRVPFVLTCHSEITLLKWQNELEAATALLMPQVIVQVEKELPDYANDLMQTALREQAMSWKKKLPVLGERRNWRWLPELM